MRCSIDDHVNVCTHRLTALTISRTCGCNECCSGRDSESVDLERKQASAQHANGGRMWVIVIRKCCSSGSSCTNSAARAQQPVGTEGELTQNSGAAKDGPLPLPLPFFGMPLLPSDFFYSSCICFLLRRLPLETLCLSWSCPRAPLPPKSFPPPAEPAPSQVFLSPSRCSAAVGALVREPNCCAQFFRHKKGFCQLCQLSGFSRVNWNLYHKSAKLLYRTKKLKWLSRLAIIG
jgi:hypothetical protein